MENQLADAANRRNEIIEPLSAKIGETIIRGRQVGFLLLAL